MLFVSSYLIDLVQLFDAILKIIAFTGRKGMNAFHQNTHESHDQLPIKQKDKNVSYL